jgi:hypothetical protein
MAVEAGPRSHVAGTGAGVHPVQAVVGTGLVPNSSKIGTWCVKGLAPNRGLAGPPVGMSRAATGYTTAAISNAPAILAKIVGILGVGIGEFLCAAATSAPKCAQVTAI